MKEEFGSFATGIPPDIDGLQHIEGEHKKFEEYSESVEIINQMAEKIETLKDRCRKLHEQSRELSDKITKKRAEYKEEYGILKTLKNNFSDSLLAGVETFQRISSCKAKISVIKTEFKELTDKKKTVGVELNTAERELAIMEGKIIMDRKVMLAMNAVFWKYGSPISVNMLKQNPAFGDIFSLQKEQTSITVISNNILSAIELSDSDEMNVNEEGSTAVKAIIEMPDILDNIFLVEKSPTNPVILSSAPIQMKKNCESDQSRDIQLQAADQQKCSENLSRDDVVDNIASLPSQTFAEETNEDHEAVQTKQNKSTNITTDDPKDFNQHVISPEEESRSLIAPTTPKSIDSQSSIPLILTTVIVENPSYSNPGTSPRKQSDNSFVFSLAEIAQVALTEQKNDEEVLKLSKKSDPAKIITTLPATKESCITKTTNPIENTTKKIINPLVKPYTGIWPNKKPPLPLFINFLSSYDQFSIWSRLTSVTVQETTAKEGIEVIEPSVSIVSVPSAVLPSAVKSFVPIENTMKCGRGRPRKNSVVHATTVKRRSKNNSLPTYFENGVDINEIQLEDMETVTSAKVTNEDNAELPTNNRRESLSRKAKTLPKSYVDLAEIYDDDFQLSPTSSETEILELFCCEKSVSTIIKNETPRKRGRPRKMSIVTPITEKLPEFVISTNQDHHASIEPPTSKRSRNDSHVLSNSTKEIVVVLQQGLYAFDHDSTQPVEPSECTMTQVDEKRDC
ncbi:hypothetical protein GCK72_023238 [Caenorhabditis remanei]|uniref:Uncharacterized protein n=1 Tax=Caenorhabditis remanei TaxID=31234 RepID=A0A6A5FWE8_CAERE|nr:hypothetical protein GCK72_023238 [Caenorhabditis remanei]KAF1746781.1 hypothetical protein GCK72_023238 [Caenorhabditis remanei]